MLGLGIFKRQKKNFAKENFKAVSVHISERQQAVFQAVEELGFPVNARTVARYLKWDTSSVCNRLFELTQKNRLQIAYRKKGLDGIYRKYYEVSK